MKIEIEEADLERIHREVVEKLVGLMYSGVKDEVAQRIKKDLLINEVREQARYHTQEIVTDMVLPDGRSFKQYVGDLLTVGGAGAYRERSRITGLIDETARQEARKIWDEIFVAHLPAMKEQLRQELLNLTLGAFIEVKR